MFEREAEVGLFAKHNWLFHSCLFEDAQRPFLMNQIRSVNDKIERYLRIQMTISETKNVDAHEHHEILAACKAGAVDLGATLLSAHILKSCESLLRNLALRRVGVRHQAHRVAV